MKASERAIPEGLVANPEGKASETARNSEAEHASPYQAYRAVRVFSSLDGLRALSILAVVWHHTDGADAVSASFPAARYGFLGVDLFFEISGFLIVTLLLRERSKEQRIDLRSFYMRRALRIFPLYYGILAACAVLFFFVHTDSPAAVHFRADLPVLAFYLANWIPVFGMFGIAWSLAAEEQFYLVWPAVERWVHRYAVALVLVIIVISQVIQLGWVDPLLQDWFGWSSSEPWMLRETTFTPICYGVLLAHLLHDRRGFVWVERLLGPRIIAPALLVSLIVVCNLLPHDIRGASRWLVQSLMALLLAACVVREDNGLGSTLRFAPIARIGALSYGIYLLHHPALALTKKLSGAVGWSSVFWLFLAGTCVSILVAEISYRFYERPFLKLKKKFR